MSKVDALRALREARYAAAAGGTKPAAKPNLKPVTSEAEVLPGEMKSAAESGKAAPKVRKQAGRSKAETPTLYVVPDTEASTASADLGAAVESEVELCGHRSMGGKSCSRPAGHPEKNHRYK